MKALFQRLDYWKLAFLLCGILSVASVLTTFLAVTETWSDDTWQNLGLFLRIRLIITCLLAGIPTVVAFLNKTVARLEEGKPLINPGDTRFIKREEVAATTTTK